MTVNIIRGGIFSCLIACHLPAIADAPYVPPLQPGPFNADVASLKQYRTPDWFRDAKFGIWSHWGPQAVPRQGDWYARNMYDETTAQYRHHLRQYGHPSKSGYKDIIPLWKAERFDPDALMALYVKAGAKYFVSMGVHHDNFDLWNSRYHSWNAVNMGPRRRTVGRAAGEPSHGARGRPEDRVLGAVEESERQRSAQRACAVNIPNMPNMPNINGISCLFNVKFP